MFRAQTSSPLEIWIPVMLIQVIYLWGGFNVQTRHNKSRGGVGASFPWKLLFSPFRCEQRNLTGQLCIVSFLSQPWNSYSDVEWLAFTHSLNDLHVILNLITSKHRGLQLLLHDMPFIYFHFAATEHYPEAASSPNWAPLAPKPFRRLCWSSPSLTSW